MSRIAIRVDVSRRLGTGHLMRCLILADVLRRRGHQVEFLCRSHGDGLAELFAPLVTARGHKWHPLTPLVAPPDVPDGVEDHRLLGLLQDEDARETAEAISDCAWVIVDHYGITPAWHSQVRSQAGAVCVINDLPDCFADCDVLIDQNLVTAPPDRYHTRVPDSCHVLLGPSWALLGPDYAAWRERVVPREGRLCRIHVFFGGVDAINGTEAVVRAFRGIAAPGVVLSVVVGGGYASRPSLEALAAGDPRVRVSGPLTSLAAELAVADLAIGAAGSSSWERLCLGVPSLVCAVAPNQVALVDGLVAHGVAHPLDSPDVDRIADALTRAVAAGADTAMSARAMRFADGRGAERVASLLESVHRPVTLAARPMAARDLGLVAHSAQTERHSGSPSWSALLADGSARPHVITLPDDTVVGAVAIQEEVERPGTLRLTAVGGVTALASERSARFVAAALSSIRRSLGPAMTMAAPGQPRLRLAVGTDRHSWIHDTAARLMAEWVADGHSVTWHHDVSDIGDADLCFLLSYSKIVRPEVLARLGRALVVHASPLPRGRGMSPLTWLLLQDERRIPVNLIAAEAELDTGDVFDAIDLTLTGTELVHEWRTMVADATHALCRRFVREWPASGSMSTAQQGEPTYFSRRRPGDSRLDPNATLASQFDLLRVSDPQAYPAWCELRGRRFHVRVSAVEEG
jgi:UDP-2,4-diacetamido-2,4,6-trideoxy-beta-L-altropyranose hydrolase